MESAQEVWYLIVSPLGGKGARMYSWQLAFALNHPDPDLLEDPKSRDIPSSTLWTSTR